MQNTDVLERSILGTMLQQNYLISDSLVKGEHFHSPIHRAIFNSMRQLVANNQVVDAATLMASNEMLGAFEDINYLFALENFANEDKFDSWTEQLMKSYQQRTVKQIMNTAMVDDWELGKVLGELNKLEIHNENDRTTAYEQARKLYNMPFEMKPKREGIRTGLMQYDSITGGLKDSELTIIAARPSARQNRLVNKFRYRFPAK